MTLRQLARRNGRARKRPTCTSPPACRPSSASMGRSRPASTRCSPRTPRASSRYSMLSDDQRKRFETTKELDFSFGIKGLSRFRANVVPPARRDLGGDPADPLRDQADGVARPAARRGGLHHPAEGSDPGHRSDRERQVDHAGGDARPHQREPARAHHHDRGSDRVHPQPQEVHRQPARDRRRHALVPGRAQVRAAAGPRT